MEFPLNTRPCLLAVLATTSLSAFGCIAADAGRVDDTAPALRTAETVTPPPTFFYLRCNSTSWNVDDHSRLVPTNTPGVLEVAIDVTQQYMTSTGDDCVLTETPVQNQWGSWQHYYGVMGNRMVVPSQAPYALEPSNQIQNFRVVYPGVGHYRAFVNTASHSLSFLAGAGLTSGDLAWTAAGAIALDAQWNVYHVSIGQDALQKLDPTTGTALWTNPAGAGNGLVFDPKCASADRIVVTEGGEPVGIDAESGANVWSSKVGASFGASASAYSTLCRFALGYVFASFNGSANGIAAIRTTDGTTAWSVATAGFSTVTLATPSAVVYTVSAADLGVFAVNPQTGRPLWSYHTVDWGNVPFADPAGNLFRSNATGLSKINPTTGQAVWTHAFNQPFPSIIQSDAIYVLSSSAYFEKVRTSDGVTLWSHGNPGAPSAPVYVYPNGIALIVGTTSSSATIDALNAANGVASWTRVSTSTFVNPFIDKQLQLYLSTGAQLERLDSTNGNTVWAFNSPVVNGLGQSTIGQVLDSDARGVYITYTTFGMFEVPTGVAALNPLTGVARWTDWTGLNLNYVGSDAQRLYMEYGTQGAAIQGLALLK